MYHWRKFDYPQRKHIRLQSHDYGSDGYYSITICTKNMIGHFGEIRNGMMGLNELGLIAHECWKEIPQHFGHVTLDEFVIMPDHMHGIVILENAKRTRRGAINRAPTGAGRAGGITGRHNPMGKGNLAEIIRWFKGRVSYEIHQKYPDANFHWHRSYHDRIVRDQRELDVKRRYIRQNPRKWKKK